MNTDLIIQILFIILLEVGIIYISYRGGWESGYSDGLDYADSALRDMMDDALGKKKDEEGNNDKGRED